MLELFGGQTGYSKARPKRPPLEGPFVQGDYNQPEDALLGHDVVAPRLAPKPPSGALEGTDCLAGRDVAQAAQRSDRRQLDTEGPDGTALRGGASRSDPLSEHLEVALDGVGDVPTDTIERLGLRCTAGKLGNFGPVSPLLGPVDLDREAPFHAGVYGGRGLSPFRRGARRVASGVDRPSGTTRAYSTLNFLGHDNFPAGTLTHGMGWERRQ
jgi:hypothetical protein